MPTISNALLNLTATLAKVEMSRVTIISFFVGGAITSFIWGVKIFLMGLRGWRAAEYPLSETKMMRGWPARIIAGAVMLFGLITFACGIGFAAFGCYRIPQLF